MQSPLNPSEKNLGLTRARVNLEKKLELILYEHEIIPIQIIDFSFLSYDGKMFKPINRLKVAWPSLLA